MSKKRNGIALFFGAIIGFVAGILSAPKSGKETRGDIQEAASGAAAQMDDKLKLLYKALSKNVKELDARAKKVTGKSKKELQNLRKRAVAVRKKIKMVLSDLHDGLVDSEDVEQVVREAEATKRKIDRVKK